MRQTSNKQYNLVDNSDKIKDSLQAWNTNFEKIDEDVTDNEERIESVSSLADNYTSNKASGTSLNITDSASSPIEDIIIGTTQDENASIVLQSKNIVDWENGTSQNADVTWEDDTLTVGGTGANLASNFNILNFVKSHPGQTLHFGYESIDFSEFSSTNNTIVQMMITNNGTTSYYTLLSRDSTSSVYTIPSDTSAITLARIRIFANNTNTEETSSITIVKPQLELGEESTEYVKYGKQTYSISELDNIKKYITTYKGGTLVYTITTGTHPNIDLTYKVNGDIYINEKVSTVQNEVDMLKSNFDTKTSEQSDNLEITDAINYTVENVKLYGKTEQNQYTGKNLFGVDIDSAYGCTYTVSNGVYTLTPTVTNPSITFKFKNPITAGTYYYSGALSTGVGFRDSNNNNISGSSISTEGTVTSAVDIWYIRYNYTATVGTPIVLNLNTVQIELGSTATGYEPYVGEQTSPSPDYPQEIKVVEGECSVQVKNEDNTKSQLATFPLAEGQKLMQGDYLAEDGIHHVRKQVVLDGTESVNVNNQSETIRSFVVKEYTSIIKRTNITDISCNMLIPKSPDDINTLRITSSGNIVLSFPKDYIDFTIPALRNKLQELYNNNTPLIIQFPLLAEEIEPYTQEQQIAWEDLQKLETYKDYTHIYTSSDDLAPNVEVTYLVNPFSSIEARLELLES